jgi:hypothetical protein
VKVGYRKLNGFTSTAYLDEDPVSSDTYAGEDKYTGYPVRVRWSDEHDEWREVMS